MTALALIAACLSVAAVTYVATGLLIRQLRRWAVLDHPNLRSSHTLPTPRGGGLAVVTVVVSAWATFPWLADTPLPPPTLSPILAGIGLALLSWFDDLGGLPPAVRLAAQVVAVSTAVFLPADPGPYFAGALPPGIDQLAALWIWVWFVNLFNFMDGIDGMAGGETAAIGAGVAVVAAVAGLGDDLIFAGLTLAAAAIGFLGWNWHPARIFLGEVGSIPIGFLVGWLLLELARRGQPEAALILPLYYLTDASVTLGRRLIRGERPWRAHREHFYQRAVSGGLSHSTVVRHVLAANALLVGLAAVAAAGRPAPSVAGAIVVVASLLLFLVGRQRRPPAADPGR
jgi:UDP-N-acetylmuramyl pentapeptide phosphotransferase/UDP-N-acetylglucosamine-1-phosphate transferase